MPVIEFLQRLGAGLIALGARRLIALAAAGLTIFVLVGISGYVLSRPDREVLYSGLDAQDVSRIGAALNEAGIAFDVSASSDAVLVNYGETAKARMILAQKGLPKSDSSGYELFDKLGSLGLTSFMQQVTRVRALEGELARSIQLIDGVKAARVHLALRNEGSFRSGKELATASVMIRSDGNDLQSSANAIRHLVAAAIPGLTADQVTVMSTDGKLLSSSDDSLSAAPEKLIGLERAMSDDIEQRISRTLAPYLGPDNFRTSVTAKLNADRRQTNEMAFDPNSRVERSVRSIKESGQAENANLAQPVSVDQNVPQEDGAKPSGDSSKEKKDRREDLTNYEINSKSIATTSEGYGIDRISIAVVVNRLQVMKALGASATPEAAAAQIAEIEQLVRSAAGLNDSRGDMIKVTAVDFVDQAEVLTPETGSSMAERLLGQMGVFVNAIALITVTLLVIFLGLRPALKYIIPNGALLSGSSASGGTDYAGSAAPMIAAGHGNVPGLAAPQFAAGADPLLDDLVRQASRGPRDRLVKIVELDPDRAAEVLRQWLVEPAGSTA